MPSLSLTYGQTCPASLAHMDTLSSSADCTQEHYADLMGHLQICVAPPSRGMKLQSALHSAMRLQKADASGQRLKVASARTHSHTHRQTDRQMHTPCMRPPNCHRQAGEGEEGEGTQACGKRKERPLNAEKAEVIHFSSLPWPFGCLSDRSMNKGERVGVGGGRWGVGTSKYLG